MEEKDSLQDAECTLLCEAADPTKMEDCIGYCQRLLLNTIEMQKYPTHNGPYFSREHQSLLFNGIQDASGTSGEQSP